VPRTIVYSSCGLALGIALLNLQAAPGAVAGAAAVRRVETAAGGGVVARLSYRVSSNGPHGLSFTEVRLTIRRRSALLLDRAVPVPCAGCALQPLGGLGGHRRSLLVRDLDGDSEPEVVLRVSTGGASCCLYTDVYAYRAGPPAGYQRTSARWAGGLQLRRLAGSPIPDFVSNDNRFDYAFTSNADSAEPIRIFEFQPGGFLDVTRRFPAQIRADARRQLLKYESARKQRGDVRGLLAAYLADTALLGEVGRGWTVIQGALRAGQLRSNGTWPGGSAYVQRLCAFLVRTGYSRDRSACPRA
jgi:hypothetical protein